MTRTHLLLTAALVLAACSATDAEPVAPTDDVITIDVGEDLPEEPDSDESETATDDDKQPLAGDVTPALGISISAADTYDDSYLVSGAGSSFVPMDNPVMVPASEVYWLEADDIVMGVVHESGETHAYPIGQMAYHHIANTTIGGEPFLVTY